MPEIDYFPDTLGIPIVLSKRAFCKYYFYSSQKGVTHQDVMAFVDFEADAVNGASMHRHIEHFRAWGAKHLRNSGNDRSGSFYKRLKNERGP